MIVFNVVLCLIILFYHKKIISFYNKILIFRNIKISSKKPTLGGYIIFINIFLFFLINETLEVEFFKLTLEKYLFLFAILSLFIIGAYDDLFSSTPFQRTAFIILVLYIFLSSVDYYQLKIIQIGTFNFSLDITRVSIFFTILCFLIIINSINMFDGINGQSGLYFFQVISYIYFQNQSLVFLFLLVIIFTFLILNLTNQIYFGDSGIYILSFILGLIFIHAYHNSYLEVEEIFIISSIHIFDLLRLFLYRVVKSKSPFSGDSMHIHHICSIKYGKFCTVLVIQIFIFIILLSLNFFNYYFSLFLSVSFYLYLINSKMYLPKKIRKLYYSFFN